MRKLPIPINKRKIDACCKKYNITYLALFGSILISHFSASSDVDILVKFHKKHIPGLFGFSDIQEELSAIVGREVDLKTPNGLSHYFRDEVLSKPKCSMENRDQIGPFFGFSFRKKIPFLMQVIDNQSIAFSLTLAYP